MTDANVGEQFPHDPVLYNEIIHALQPVQGGLYVDGTVGAGGHAWGILQASSPEGRLLGLDVDPQALELARLRLSLYEDRAILVQASYALLKEQLRAVGWQEVHGVLLDLGLSSMQVDTPERGFSFQVDAPLDMRFDPRQSLRAADLVNGLSEAELADVLFRYGEERQARQIARAIVQFRPIESTGALADLIVRATAGRKAASGRGRRDGGGHLHPATLTFQALRIAVNQELSAIECVLPQAVEALAPGGRLAVISFHSLEDRIVKQFFRRESQDCICPPRQPVCTCGHKAKLVELNRRPVQAGSQEVMRNPRSRSARLRVAQKLADNVNL